MDQSKVHSLARKVGGRFHLASLVQKRLLELNRGQRRLVSEDSGNPLDIVLREIDEGMIELAAPEEEKALEGTPPTPQLEKSLDAEG